MLKEAVLHMSDSSFAYSISENSLILKIRVKKDDVDQVNLYYGDRYEPVKEINCFCFHIYVKQIYTRGIYSGRT